MEFKNGEKILFKSYEVDGAPAFAYDKEPLHATETELNLTALVEDGEVYFIDVATNEKYTFDQLIKYADNYIFERID